jgi:hypothetical protein
MYGYYALPSLRFLKSYITFYQTSQHIGAIILILFHTINNCNVYYPYINILGYMYFLYEYLSLLLSMLVKKNGYLENTSHLKIDTPITIISCLMYLTNAAHSYIIYSENKDHNTKLLSHSFLFLTATSVVCRVYPKLFFLDNIAVINIMFQGGNIAMKKYIENGLSPQLFIVISLFLFVVNIHSHNSIYYSKTNIDYINYSHALFIHIASSIGLHILVET